MQGKNSVPKGDLDHHYRDGCLFITYSLLVTRSGLVQAQKKAGGGRGRGSRNNSRNPSPTRDGAAPTENNDPGAGPSNIEPARMTKINKGTRLAQARINIPHWKLVTCRQLHKLACNAWATAQCVCRCREIDC